ncbi:hypothetical protein K438DRAFT_1013100 [Mycena galopus ATCC 62051]|nr:hypothetical protein K438DRAFT_1013100 [Mycena galopus ATCC 62051]
MLLTLPPDTGYRARRDPSLRPHVHDDDTLYTSAGKNRRQLAWAGARSFALRYVRDRLYQGRFGERDPDVDAEHAHEPSFIQALRREARSEWRPEWDDPAWRVGWPRDTEPVAAALWVMWFFESEETLRAEPESLRRHIMTLLLPMVAAPFRYPSALAPPHHYTVPLLAAVHASTAIDPDRNANGLTFPTHHGPYPIYPLDVPSHQAQAAGSPAGSAPSPPASSSSSSSPPRDAHPGRRSRRGFPRSRSRLLAASPARLLFFARMQAGQRFDVPPLPRTRADATHLWQSGGNTGPPPIRPTQEDLHEKNARPLVRFERPLPFSLPFSPDASASGAAPDPIPIPSLASTSALAHLAVDPDLDAPSSLVRSRPRRDERWAPYRWRARLCRGYHEGRDGRESERERGRRYSGGVVRRSGRGGARDVDVDAASSHGAAPAGTSTGTSTGQGKGGAPCPSNRPTPRSSPPPAAASRRVASRGTTSSRPQGRCTCASGSTGASPPTPPRRRRRRTAPPRTRACAPAGSRPARTSSASAAAKSRCAACPRTHGRAGATRGRTSITRRLTRARRRGRIRRTMSMRVPGVWG